MQGKSTGLGNSRRARSEYGDYPSLSPWINGEFPRWSDLLTTHDVARLTRRHIWFISVLVLMGRFPKRTRFHGCGIGWNRREVHDWMARRRRCISTRALSRHVGAVQLDSFGSRHSPGEGP
jgi:predicted DNA-binding transcriptional regulator AlpA